MVVAYEYSKSKIIARWLDEGQVFVAVPGKRKHLRNNLLGVALSDLKEPVQKILADGFTVKDTYEILRRENLIPDYVSLAMFYRWRRQSLIKGKDNV